MSEIPSLKCILLSLAGNWDLSPLLNFNQDLAIEFLHQSSWALKYSSPTITDISSSAYFFGIHSVQEMLSWVILAITDPSSARIY